MRSTSSETPPTENGHIDSTVTGAPGETFHHLTGHGYELELCPSRHNAGSNLFAYFWVPAANREELSAEIARWIPAS